jgi:putative tryptophan/tyrosine transport system permease protein
LIALRSFPLMRSSPSSSLCLLASRLGLMLHAFGNNPTLLHLCGKNGGGYRMLGLSLSNGLVAYSGSLTAQINGYADIGMGVGMILIALGTVIIGQQIYTLLFKDLPFAPLMRLICCFLAAVLYFSTVYALLALGLDPIYLRLMIGICLIIFLGTTQKNFTKRITL